MESREKTKEQLKEDLRKTREEVAIQKWGIEKTLGGMKVLVKELIQKEKEAKEAKAKDEAIIVSVGDGLVAVDRAGKILMVNKAFEELLGWKQDEVVGKPMAEVIPREDEASSRVPLEERILTQVLAGKKVTTSSSVIIPVFYYIRKDGTKFPTASIITPIVLGNKIVGAVEIFRDITQEKDVDKAKTEFVSLASHQLLTPLTSISWYTEMILKGDVGEVIPGQKKYLEKIYQGNKRMVKLVNTLLNVSRLELGTFKVESKPTDVVKLAQGVIGELRFQINQKKLKFDERHAEGLPMLNIDPTLLSMVFQNLLANAVEYTPEGGRIEFTISLDDKKTTLIKVSDTGYGIPKNQQDQIFTKLFRADNVKAKDTEGTGLGLYIAKSIVEQSGGKIWFESEENKGTTFYVALPLDGMKKKEGTKALT